MKKFFNSITNKINSIAVSAKTAIANTRAEGYVDSGVKILSQSSLARSSSPVSTHSSTLPSCPP